MAKPDTSLSRMAGVADGAESLQSVNDHVHVSRGMGNSILITGAGANVAVNAGLPDAGAGHRARFEEVSDAPLAFLVLTQSHLNQFGGAHDLMDPDTKVIAQVRFLECRRTWRALDGFYKRRSRKLWRGVLRDRSQAVVREVVPDITFEQCYRFEVGGRMLELYATPGGESLDASIVWLPQDRLAITGNLFGPLFGHLPNLYTIRGDRIRSALRFVESLERVRDLKPETLVTGHEVIRGAAGIAGTLARIREAVRHIYDQTIAGMNAGRDVHSLMREVTLPPGLNVGQGHGKVPWCVRAIWEEHAGWFHYDSTTSLYAVPPSDVAPDIVELAGGGEALTARAERYLGLAKPLEALHLVEPVLHAVPADRRALAAKLAAHQLLLEQCDGQNFSEVQWLKSEIDALERALAEAP